jgi:hypothetical protein
MPGTYRRLARATPAAEQALWLSLRYGRLANQHEGGNMATVTVTLTDPASARSVSATVPDPRPDVAVDLAVAGVAIAVGSAIGWSLLVWLEPGAYRPADSFVALAALLVIAQAVERVLALVSLRGSPTDEPLALARSARAAARGALHDGQPDVARAHAARAAWFEAEAARLRAKRSIRYWGWASALALTTCGAFGVLMIRAVSDTSAGYDPNRFVDLLVTGLIVGAGTKPLHELIKRLSRPSSGVTVGPATEGANG